MTLHRTSGLLKQPGSGPLGWHTDHSGAEPLPPRSPGHILNRGTEPNGCVFYLNGSHPARGGLAVIADSHRRDWEAPPGFELCTKAFRPRGLGGADGYAKFDVPGCVPIWSAPNDLVLFACRTYHNAFPTPPDWGDVRHSVGLRPRDSGAQKLFLGLKE
jgi:hypothetical protein